MNFSQLLKKSSAYLAQKAKDAVNWYKEKILKLGKSSSLEEPDNVFKKVGYPEIGKMYLFTYYPRFADEKPYLPFWDENPLVIPIKYVQLEKGAGFMGLNFHYLPPTQRANLLQALLDLKNNDKYDDTTKLNISYKILVESTKYPGYQQCVKKYYLGNVRSSYSEVNSNDWENVVLLPLQRWIINPRNPGKPPY